ncbi:hypothetical protein CORT_0C03920 [Candida orthopsilosis Co 90-125]|uniref:Uncharacterized protein n=1 Tax=Candida orthopsilosis (strain 90-125) TaxID=1136231 RepID=H8X3X8_CANO9|nr:hypothetical protein CORT_0C03920 [Candida orthopsilosis Co 90-125]CCG25766.1 hypothetical protein CORT_0C03920 [Candida orthopsilosis Co 90-125]
MTMFLQQPSADTSTLVKEKGHVPFGGCEYVDFSSFSIEPSHFDISQFYAQDLASYRVETLPYIAINMPEVEVSFYNYYNKLLRTCDGPKLERYKTEMFPLLESRTVRGFFTWLRQMVLYKHEHCIPDVFIRGVLVANAGFTDDEGLNLWVDAVTRAPFGLVWFPIGYRYLFRLEKLYVTGCSS